MRLPKATIGPCSSSRGVLEAYRVPRMWKTLARKYGLQPGDPFRQISRGIRSADRPLPLSRHYERQL